MTIEPKFSLDPPSQINHLVPDGVVAKDSGRPMLFCHDRKPKPGLTILHRLLDLATERRVNPVAATKCPDDEVVRSPSDRILAFGPQTNRVVLTISARAEGELPCEDEDRILPDQSGRRSVDRQLGGRILSNNHAGSAADDRFEKGA